MSMQIAMEAMSNNAPPTIAPTRDILSAIVCSRSIGSRSRLVDQLIEPAIRFEFRCESKSRAKLEVIQRSRRGCRQPKRRADGCIPLLCAFDATALGPTVEDRALEQLLVRFRLLRLDCHKRRRRQLAHGARLLAGIAVVSLAGRRFDRRPHLVFIGLELADPDG